MGALNETKLSTLDIDEPKGWYVDDGPHGYQIDAFGWTSVIPPAGRNVTLLLSLYYASYFCSLSHYPVLYKFIFVI